MAPCVALAAGATPHVPRRRLHLHVFSPGPCRLAITWRLKPNPIQCFPWYKLQTFSCTHLPPLLLPMLRTVSCRCSFKRAETCAARMSMRGAGHTQPGEAGSAPGCTVAWPIESNLLKYRSLSPGQPCCHLLLHAHGPRSSSTTSPASRWRRSGCRRSSNSSSLIARHNRRAVILDQRPVNLLQLAQACASDVPK